MFPGAGASTAAAAHHARSLASATAGIAIRPAVTEAGDFTRSITSGASRSTTDDEIVVGLGMKQGFVHEETCEEANARSSLGNKVRSHRWSEIGRAHV